MRSILLALLLLAPISAIAQSQLSPGDCQVYAAVAASGKMEALGTAKKGATAEALKEIPMPADVAKLLKQTISAGGSYPGTPEDIYEKFFKECYDAQGSVKKLTHPEV